MKENQKIKIALIQLFATNKKSDNLQKGLKAADEAAMNGAQIICFAELAFEPFYPQRRPDPEVDVLAETIPGTITDAFSELAKKHGVVIILNLFELENGKTFDSSPVIDADGNFAIICGYSKSRLH
jgi:N-carbamoylputrescine amidase